MNPSSLVLRWYRQSTGRARHHQPFTAEEVLRLLRPPDPRQAQIAGDPVRDRVARLDAVREVAARPSAWLAELTDDQRREIGGLADRLPSLVFHHAVGGEPDELVRRFGGWSAWRYERALEIAGACIAGHLNGSARAA